MTDAYGSSNRSAMKQRVYLTKEQILALVTQAEDTSVQSIPNSAISTADKKNTNRSHTPGEVSVRPSVISKDKATQHRGRVMLSSYDILAMTRARDDHKNCKHNPRNTNTKASQADGKEKSIRFPLHVATLPQASIARVVEEGGSTKVQRGNPALRGPKSDFSHENQENSLRSPPQNVMLILESTTSLFDASGTIMHVGIKNTDPPLSNHQQYDVPAENSDQGESMVDSSYFTDSCVTESLEEPSSSARALSVMMGTNNRNNVLEQHQLEQAISSKGKPSCEFKNWLILICVAVVTFVVAVVIGDILGTFSRRD